MDLSLTPAQRLGVLSKHTDFVLAVGVISIIMVLVLPLAPFLLDILLTISFSTSIMVLFVALFTRTALDFSSFPSILLISTLFRLSLNIASTRLILGDGNQGINAAGSVIKAFGDFVVGGNFVVGIIIFLILVIINFVVITKGSGRIAEVAARFTLDAMPGKQMAIDADLNAGIINDQDAKSRRERIQHEADFYGAMDGASKFVRGDAIAGLIITGVNIVGGLVIGMLQYGMTLQSAFGNYTTLTVGDGLVAQIPALVISLAAGIAVTKNSNDNKTLGENIKSQFTDNYRAMGMSALIIGGFAVIPGMPSMPLLIVGGLAGLIAWRVFDLAKKQQEAAVALDVAEVNAAEKDGPEEIEGLLPIDRLGIELGYGLVPLVDSDQDGELLERIKSIRRQLALELGFIVPPIHIKDNLELASGEYSIVIKGVEVGRSETVLDHLLAMKTGDVEEQINGIDTIEPAFGLPAQWIHSDEQEHAQYAGYTVVDIPTVISTHLIELIKQHAPEFLGRQETQRLIDNFAKQEPKVVEELIPNVLPLGTVQKILQNMLRERVSVRDLHTILETAADMGTMTKDADLLTEYVRQNMARTISRQYQTDDGKLPLISLAQQWEDKIASAIQTTSQGTSYLGIDPETAQILVQGMETQMERFAMLNYQPILLCSPLIRPHVRRLIERFIPNLVVLSHNEIAPDVRIESLGIIN